MALSFHEIVGNGVPTSFKDKTPIATASREITLQPGEPVELRLDNVGAPNFAALAERSSDTLPVEGLHGFAAYQKAGGVFSEGLYKTLMDGIIDLQKPGVKENSHFPTGTEAQISGFEDRHNRPFLGAVLPPEQQIFLTEPQKDAYRLLRDHLFIPGEDRKNKAYYDDASLFKEIRIIPGLKPNELSEQEQLAGTEQPQALAEAA